MLAMKKTIIMAPLMILIFSCDSPNSSKPETEVVIVHDTIYKTDTILSAGISDELIASPDTIKEELSKGKKTEEKKSPEKKADPKLIESKIEEGVHYYKESGRVSVREFPWKDDRKKIEVYDRSGDITYEFEDVLLSYQSKTTFQFRADGSLEIAKVRTNPGASMYWGESTISFSPDNEPLVKIDHTYPETQLELRKKALWDKIAKKWVMQTTQR